jgi:DNA-binding FadR family transcriptional regulator
MMSRQQRSRDLNPFVAGPAIEPLSPPRNLTDEVVQRLSALIRSGRLAPGARLPTEMELMKAFGVSRTVIREAVAVLKAEGQVITRQGSGAFVTSDSRRVPFRIESRDAGAACEVVSIMELRLAVEIEAAALAAERATRLDLDAIGAAHSAFGRAIRAGEAAVREDFAFHHAIAKATHNDRFADFLAFIGHHVIPRQVVGSAAIPPDERLAYFERILREHARIRQAIEAHNPAEARRAMRAHLTRSLARYGRLAAEAEARKA